jgi:Spy/CpxP family protein refolding chaperone
MAILEPQFEAFRKNVDAIEQQFRSSFEAILNPEQKHKFEVIKNRLANLPDLLPGCGPIIGPVFVSMVIYRPLLEHFTEALALDDKQQKQLKDLLIDRRNKLITLVDETPPPSFKLEKVVPPSGTP